MEISQLNAFTMIALAQLIALSIKSKMHGLAVTQIKPKME